MPDDKRIRFERDRNFDIGRSQQVRRRGEDIFGTGDDYYAEGYPRTSRFPLSFATRETWDQRSMRSQYHQENEDVGNYGVGGYYGNTYRQHGDQDRERYWQSAPVQRRGYRPNDERLEDQTQVHRGKGPKNYQRSDSRIYDDINDYLSEDSFVDASDIEVRVTNGEVMLIGSVESSHDKRRAEDIAESAVGVKNVENRLKVRRNSDWRNRDGNFENRMMETKG